MSPSVLSQIDDNKSDYNRHLDTAGKGEGEELEDGTRGVRHGFGV